MTKTAQRVGYQKTAMRILTVRQPWAWAIVHGQKDVENRVRNIAGDYRGPVAIHAAKAVDLDAPKTLWGDYHDSGLEVLGAIIGVVDLVGVHAGWIEGVPCSPWGIRYVEGAGQHHIELANPRPLVGPIPYKGALGLRPLDAETIARIEGASAEKPDVWVYDDAARARVKAALDEIDALQASYPRCVVCGQRCSRLDKFAACSKVSEPHRLHRQEMTAGGRA